MNHFASRSFWTAYHQLPPDIRELADKRFALLKTDVQHPSLNFKKVGNYWSVRVGLGYRALAREVEGGFLWRWVGTHDDYIRQIRAS